MVLHHHWGLIAALLKVLGCVVDIGRVHYLTLIYLTEALVLTLTIAWHIIMAIVHHKLLLIVHVHKVIRLILVVAVGLGINWVRFTPVDYPPHELLATVRVIWLLVSKNRCHLVELGLHVIGHVLLRRVWYIVLLGRHLHGHLLLMTPLLLHVRLLVVVGMVLLRHFEDIEHSISNLRGLVGVIFSFGLMRGSSL
jgi:hypothetical protein